MDQTLTLLHTYSYGILFPLSIFEGPLITIVAGFLCTQGFMHPVIVYGIVVLGDITGDTILYSIGRLNRGKSLGSIGRWLGVTPERMYQIRQQFNERHIAAVSASKLVHGIGFAGLIAAGHFKIPYLQFIRTCIVITLVQSLIFLAAGLFFGHAYTRLATYLDAYAALISICTIIIIIGIAFHWFKRNTSHNVPRS
jgi:membrane protein DedA with SNARE-associated domain